MRAVTSLVVLVSLASSAAGFVFPSPATCAQCTSRGLRESPRVGIPTRLASAQVELDEEDDLLEDDRIISLTDKALTHLADLRQKQGGKDLVLRMGVRSGGCSGLSYVMDLVEDSEIEEDDMIEDYPEHGFRAAIDPKSMLYLYGMKLDYSDALVGGGFQFFNPNAESSCGCGKSFGV